VAIDRLSNNQLPPPLTKEDQGEGIIGFSEVVGQPAERWPSVPEALQHQEVSSCHPFFISSDLRVIRWIVINISRAASKHTIFFIIASEA